MADDVIYFRVHGDKVKPAHRIPANGSVEIRNTYPTAYVVGFSETPASVTPAGLTNTGNNYQIPASSVATFTFTNTAGSDIDVNYGTCTVDGTLSVVPTPTLGHTIIVTKGGGFGGE